MDVLLVAFIFSGMVAVSAAVAMITTRNMVYSVLFMVIVFLATSVIYLLFQAPLIAFVQITVYAGGIMVLFLFVVMLIGAQKMAYREPLRWQRPLAFGLTGALLIEMIALASLQVRWSDPANVEPSFGSPREVGLMLFNQYALPFEIISVLLLVAVVGVIVLNPGKGTK